MANRSNFNFLHGTNTIAIEDLQPTLGGMTVTNDVENVIHYIAISMFGEVSNKMDSYAIVYRDSEGIWDGIKTVNGEFDSFVYLGAHSMEEAIDLIQGLQTSNVVQDIINP